MKKIIIGATALGLSVALVGCGNSSNNAAITNLSSQLDSTANTISGVQTVNPTDFNMTKETLDRIATKNNSDDIYNNVNSTQQALMNEEYYKMSILNKTATLKNNLSKNLKLSKAQTGALKDLTNNLTKYTNSVAYTKNEMNSTIKSISSLKKNADKNSERINAKLNRLACNSNTRLAYYENILNTLAQIENYVDCEDCTENQQSDIQENANSEEETKTLTKNIDTYLPNVTNNNETRNQINDNCPQNQNNCNENITNSYNVNNYNRMNGTNGFYGNAYGAPVGYYGSNSSRMAAPNGYGMGFGYRAPYGFNYAGFNPNRNTDTYAPMARNIDTYRFGNAEYGTFANLNTPVAPVASNPDQPDNETQNMIEKDNLAIENSDETIFKNDLKEECTSNCENLSDKDEFLDFEPSSINIEKEETQIDKKHTSVDDEIKPNETQTCSMELPKIRIMDIRKNYDDLNQPTVAHNINA